MKPEEAKKQTQETTLKLLHGYIKIVQNKFNKLVTYVDSPEYADNDFVISVGGSFHHFLEVKIRFNEFKKYWQTKVPLRKHAVAEHYFRAGGIRTYFLCRFSCGTVGVLDLTKEPKKVQRMLARADRGSAEDVYALYDLSDFKILDIAIDK